MNWLQLQQKLIAAARQSPASAEVPYAFEKRVMARLQAPIPGPDWAVWTRGFWYGAGACAAVMLLIGLWTGVPGFSNSAASLSFAEDLEQSILASSENPDGTWW